MSATRELTKEEHLLVFEIYEALFDLPENKRAAALAERGLDPAVHELCEKMFARMPSPDASALLAPSKLIDTELAKDIYGSALMPNLPAEFDGYRIVGLLGQGGMGLVFEARQIDVDRRVAIKVVAHREPDETHVQRFQEEIDALARLEHPAIVNVLSSGAVATDRGDIPYFALEFIDGSHFDRWASEKVDRDPRSILEKTVTIAQALDHAHRRGVVHRDIKPQNLMIDEEGHPHVLDFGIARRIDQDVLTSASLTQDSAVLGTMHYIAPEQLLAAKEVDARADIYSLGVVLHESLTGERPLALNDTNWVVAAAQIQALKPRSLRESREELGGDLELVVRKCLEKDRSLRYATCSDLADDLQNWLEGRPVKARPPGAVYRLRRALRRNQIATGAVALVAVIALALVFVWRAEAEDRKIKLGQIADLAIAAELPVAWDSARNLVPIVPDQIDALEAWIARYSGRVDDSARRALALDPELLPTDLPVDEAAWRAATAAFEEFRTVRVKPIARRLQIARNMRDVWPNAHRAAWDRAIAEIEANPLFGGLRMRPHWDLLPLFDERFPLPVFLHLPTHEGAPKVDRYPKEEFADERIRIEERTGILLVLVPEVPDRLWTRIGEEWLPAPAESGPYLLGMHEVTIAQWSRMNDTRKVPNLSKVGFPARGPVGEILPTNPVEYVSVARSKDVLSWFSFSLPRRRHTEGAMMCDPNDPDASWLDSFDNTRIVWLDRVPLGYVREDQVPPPYPNPTQTYDWFNHVPVDRFPASASGFHGLLGNVAEWLDTPKGEPNGRCHISGVGFFGLLPNEFAGRRNGHRPPLQGAIVPYSRPDVGVRVWRSTEPPF